ncbi:MAG TPA: GNAT family N-acetyltransferase [Thermoplasmata archaeon]|nr:GNAT family N-acetyltransferase [Thermoplasmata archaeon]
MVDPRGGYDREDRVLAGLKAFVLALGGFSLEVSGASLVTHERALAPLFNYVSVDNVGPDRQAAFFERALDHYFQRALRPRVLTRTPTPAHLDEGLRRFGFRPAEEPVLLLEASAPPAGAEVPGPFEVARLAPTELARIVPFWASERERPEIARAFEVLAFHPNPGETFAPLVAARDGRDLASAVLYSDGRVAGLHGIGTVPAGRGLGAASALVGHALRHEFPAGVGALGTLLRDRRGADRLERLGFDLVGTRTEYVLPDSVDLRFPPPGPPTPPRWRPPRGLPD